MKRRRIAPVDVRKIGNAHRPKLHRAVLDGLRKVQKDVNVSECVRLLAEGKTNEAIAALHVRTHVARRLVHG